MSVLSLKLWCAVPKRISIHKSASNSVYVLLDWLKTKSVRYESTKYFIQIQYIQEPKEGQQRIFMHLSLCQPRSMTGFPQSSVCMLMFSLSSLELPFCTTWRLILSDAVYRYIHTSMTSSIYNAYHRCSGGIRQQSILITHTQLSFFPLII